MVTLLITLVLAALAAVFLGLVIVAQEDTISEEAPVVKQVSPTLAKIERIGYMPCALYFLTTQGEEIVVTGESSVDVRKVYRELFVQHNGCTTARVFNAHTQVWDIIV